MRALGLLESLLGLPSYELQKLALLRSNKTFVGGMTAVQRNGIDIPLSFIRYASEDGVDAVPICPECLYEEAYIRQAWHLKPIRACAKHKCELVHQCPECQEPINYIENESIDRCVCGFEFIKASSAKACQQDIKLSGCLISGDDSSSSPLFASVSTTHRFAALAWHQKRYPEKHQYIDAIEYFKAWPDNFYRELDTITSHADLRLVNLFNKTAFKFIYGDLILQSQCIHPEEKEPHFIHSALMEYLRNLVESHPKSKKSNVADMLVSVAETAALLSTNYEQVYRLYQDGVLSSGYRQKMKQRVAPHVGVFYLRQVIEYKASFGANGQGVYLSSW
ncbi:TniQ family protein [Shewanella sp. HL-SH2]|uniref:TniQ family protein n=1 Tax=Shewanella sp. HL-SH2 TaxID=3436238 RepID=UPI003EB9DEBA